MWEVEMIVKEGRTPRILPFAMDDIERTDDRVLRYSNLRPSLVHLLRDTVEANPSGEALVELGGERLSYQETWDRAASPGAENGLYVDPRELDAKRRTPTLRRAT
jgi:hypothetical protein